MKNKRPEIGSDQKPLADFGGIAQAIARRRKEAVLYIRINRQDLDNLKKKARRYKVPYQSVISEILHRYAS
jgi:predicted DNA binding CopG/RHH family protein